MGHNIYSDSYSPPPQSRDLPRASQPVGRHWTSHHRWSVPLQPGLHALMNTLCSSLFVFCPNITQFSRNSLTNDSWQLINHYIVASSTSLLSSTPHRSRALGSGTSEAELSVPWSQFLVSSIFCVWKYCNCTSVWRWPWSGHGGHKSIVWWPVTVPGG